MRDVMQDGEMQFFALVSPLKQGLRVVGQYSWPGPSTGARPRSLPRSMFVLRNLSGCHGSNSVQ